jgi:hypothetical protein
VAALDKTLASWLAMGLILELASFCSVPAVNAQQAFVPKPTKPLPYFITQEETIHHPDGSIDVEQGQVPVWERVFGQRADGATVHIEWSKSYPRAATRNVWFPDKGITISVNAVNDNKVTSGAGIPVDMERGTHIDHIRCGAGSSFVGEETIQGFKVIHTKRSSDGEVTESWLAPALDCMEVRTILTTDCGYTTAIEPIILSDKAPDESYFAIRDGLKEVDPITFRQSMSDKPLQLSAERVEREMRSYEAEKAAREKAEGR